MDGYYGTKNFKRKGPPAGFEPTAIRSKALKRIHWPRTLCSCVHRYSMCIKYSVVTQELLGATYGGGSAHRRSGVVKGCRLWGWISDSP
jgi:hypothetical protein